MSWALIVVKSASLQLISTAIDLLAQQGEEVSKVFVDADESVFYVDENGTSASRIATGREGLGFYLNRCIEACDNDEDRIDWFLVLGGDLNPELTFTELADGINKAVSTRQTVVSFGGSSLLPSTSALVGLHTQRGPRLLSSGDGGCMIVPKDTWIDVSGFREDIGSWGIELHFALDTLSRGSGVQTIPWSALSARSNRDRDDDTHLVSALVAYATYSEGQGLPFRTIFWIRSWLWLLLDSPKASLGKFLRAREILRTREFFGTGR